MARRQQKSEAGPQPEKGEIGGKLFGELSRQDVADLVGKLTTIRDEARTALEEAERELKAALGEHAIRESYQPYSLHELNAMQREIDRATAAEEDLSVEEQVQAALEKLGVAVEDEDAENPPAAPAVDPAS